MLGRLDAPRLQEGGVAKKKDKKSEKKKDKKERKKRKRSSKDKKKVSVCGCGLVGVCGCGWVCGCVWVWVGVWVWCGCGCVKMFARPVLLFVLVGRGGRGIASGACLHVNTPLWRTANLPWLAACRS